VIGRGFAVLLAALASIFAAPLLAAPTDTHEWSNCPPRVLSQFYSHFTEFVPPPIADADRHPGRRAELNWCGQRARPAALAADALLLAGWTPLGVLIVIDLRRRRPQIAIVVDDTR
jgi:hypothetical protein